MENKILRLIIESMRLEISDRISYLEHLKKMTLSYHNGVSMAMENKILRFIIESMRLEISNRISYLEHLKSITFNYHNGVSIENLQKEIDEIAKLIEKEIPSESEKEEFLIVKNVLETLKDSKSK
jgi:gamma-glutamyltranspeptidase